jgi:magnesium transporter
MVHKLFRKRAKKGGLPPGTLVYVGEKPEEKVRITVIDYDEKHLEEKKVETVEECLPFREKPTVTWVNADGIHRVDIIEKMGKHFDLHPLLLEDIVNTGQRPKMDDYGDNLFIILKMIRYDEKAKAVDAEQVSLILGPSFVISFQEREGDVFDAVRDRIRTAKGRIRKMGADYLAYSLMDAIVDNYFSVLEGFGENFEVLEEELMTNPATETLQTIQHAKREILMLRKSVWPLREVISRMERGENPLVKKTTIPYLRDVYDHTIQVNDTIETYRDMLSGMLDIYLSSASNRMNEVMKVLTIIATIFIPLTFIAGVYGMNFKYMPELEWRWGYFAVWGVILVIAGIMALYFRRKKWI